MTKAELKPCGCEEFWPFATETHICGIYLYTEIVCLKCGKTARGRTYEKAVAAWNRRAGDGK